MATAPPVQAEVAFLAPVSDLTRRIEIYESDAVTPWADRSNDGRLKGGSVTVDYSRDERRNFDLELDNSDFGIVHAPSSFWYDKIIKVYSGVRYIDTTPILSTVVRTNLCTNPSFEVDTAGWGNNAFGYTAASTITRDTSRATQGNACMKVTWPTGKSCTFFGFPTTNGVTYTFSIDVYVPGGSPVVQVGDVFGPGTLSTKTNQWERISATLVGDGGTRYFGVQTENPTAGQMCYVDAALIEASQTANNGYFSGATQNFANRAYAWTGTANASTSTETITVSTPSAVSTTWETQIGEFMIDSIAEDHFPNVVKVTGRDYTKKCLLSKYANATSYAKGTKIEDAVKSIAQAAGITKFILPLTGKTLGADYFFERGTARWEAMKQIADAFGYELFFDAKGYLVMREYLDPVTAPLAYTLSTGNGGTLSSYTKSLNDSRLYNHIVVTGESSDSTTLTVSAEAINTDPSSPTRVDKIGDRLYQYSSAFITTTAQAQDVANKFLKIHALEEFDLNFNAIALPWLEVGEIIQFNDPRPAPDQPNRFLLSSLTFPLGLGAMSGNAKRVSLVG